MKNLAILLCIAIPNMILTNYVSPKEENLPITTISNKVIEEDFSYSLPMPPLPPEYDNIINTKQTKANFKYMWVTATAYCPCSICCGTCSPGITKKGTDAWTAGIATDPRYIPLGSYVDIPGYQRGPNQNGSWILCDDIGGKIKGLRIDVRFKSHQKAKEWGVRYIKIKVYE